MSTGRPPPGTIPTLTEVVPWAGGAPLPAPPPTTPPVAAPPVQASPPPVAMAPVADAALAENVLAGIQKQIDLVLEVRLREALAPALSRATDALVRDARRELNTTLRDIVAQAVAREIARRDGS